MILKNYRDTPKKEALVRQLKNVIRLKLRIGSDLRKEAVQGMSNKDKEKDTLPINNVTPFRITASRKKQISDQSTSDVPKDSAQDQKKAEHSMSVEEFHAFAEQLALFEMSLQETRLANEHASVKVSSLEVLCSQKSKLSRKKNLKVKKADGPLAEVEQFSSERKKNSSRLKKDED